ncbi:MAG: tetratricopeptide repeat protein [Deltaproteobacteria bacterium]|nr:MAG: tetratricopeptide repeat protein [Deltaproteobacteria bacterium]
MTKTCALLLALLLPASAMADARADAKRHFRNGMALIAAGRVERGIAELKQAYAIKPHPVVLYDIARAYVDIGNIEEALGYFRQYVATNPVDKERVLKVMQRLEAAIGKTPQTVPIVPTTASGQPVDVQKLIEQLQALIAQGQAAQAAMAAAAAAPPSQPPAPVKTVPASAKPGAPAAVETLEPAVISAKSKTTAKEIAAELAASATGKDEDLFDEQIITATPAKAP